MREVDGSGYARKVTDGGGNVLRWTGGEEVTAVLTFEVEYTAEVGGDLLRWRSLPDGEWHYTPDRSQDCCRPGPGS